MSETSITPLWVRSGYSMLRGVATPQRLVELAAGSGCAGLAMTDVNNLCGATVFHKCATKAGIKPIIGAELMEGRRSVVALVDSQAGYENLCQIITRLHRRSDGSAVGVPPASSSVSSSFAQQQKQQQDEAKMASARAGGTPTAHSDDFLDDLPELSDGLHFIADSPALLEDLSRLGLAGRVWAGLDSISQPVMLVRRLTESADRLGVPLVATGRALITEPADAEVARLLAAIRTGATFDTVKADELPHGAATLRGPRILCEQLADWPGALSANRELAARCGAFALLPRKPVFPDFDCAGGMTPVQYLRQLCHEGLTRRYGSTPPSPAAGRLERELGLIASMGFAEYFLVVWDLVQYARRRGTPVAGRGSGASSLVAYLLGITNVCPIAYGIPFERFLHEQREDFPDLDVDFCWRLRDEVIDYAFKRWGAGMVAMVSMHGTFQGASAIRETAKAFGYSDDQISRMEENISGDESAGGDRYAGHGHKGKGLCSSRITSLARRLLGLPRNLSVHPGGIVIGRMPIDHYVPVQRAAKGVDITQFDKDGIEDIRLVKLDLLGNRNLSTIRYAVDLIRRHRGLDIDLETLPDGDADTVALLRAADTVGCNQLESPAMRSLSRMINPSGTRDVMKVLALIRPGAASIGMKEVFVRRHRGLDLVPVDHPAIAAVLGDTYGVMLYEDDVLLVGAAMLNCSLGQADRFRKAVQKCHDDRARLGLSRDFLSRCRANGLDMDYAKGLWVQMAKFNEYSFCRAHAASYALLAYAGAYIKAHWPLEFWASALNNNQSMYPIRVYVEQAKRAGIRFLLPDANCSDEEFAIAEGCGSYSGVGILPASAEGVPPSFSSFSSSMPQQRKQQDAPVRAAALEARTGSSLAGTIRVGLNRVEGLGAVGVRAILDARGRDGPFQSLSDFLARTGLGQTQARSLILCGAFDWTERGRPTLMMELNLFLSLRHWRRDATDPVRPLLHAQAVIPNVPGDYEPARKYTDERHVLGLTVGPHLLSVYRPALAEMECIDSDSRQLPARKGRTVRIAGMLEAQRITRTQGGQTMQFLTLDDEWGLFEAVLFPDACRRLGAALRHYGPYLVTGKVDEQYDAINISADCIELLAPRTADVVYSASG